MSESFIRLNAQHITQEDQLLIEKAIETIKARVLHEKHNLASAFLTESGEIITGINVAGTFGCNDICAEQITLGKALSDGKNAIKTVVTVRYPKPKDNFQEIRVVNPCGKCRELLIDYIPAAEVIMRDENNQLIKIKVEDLIQHRYRK